MDRMYESHKKKKVRVKTHTEDVASVVLDPALVKKLEGSYRSADAVPIIAGETKVVDVEVRAADATERRIPKKKLRRQKFLQHRKEKEEARIKLFEALSYGHVKLVLRPYVALGKINSLRNNNRK